MAAISPSEVRPGLVVHLDTQNLRTLGGSLTNAMKNGNEDRAVAGPHYFLIVAVDPVSQGATAVPLFSQSGPGSHKLDPAKKGGSLPLWTGAASYFSCWQHWRIPISDLVAASAGEVTTPTDRCTYAESDPTTLNAIAAWADKNRCPYRKP